MSQQNPQLDKFGFEPGTDDTARFEWLESLDPITRKRIEFFRYDAYDLGHRSGWIEGYKKAKLHPEPTNTFEKNILRDIGF